MTYIIEKLIHSGAIFDHFSESEKYDLIDMIFTPDRINCVDCDGKTSLIYAVNNMNLEIIKELLQHNADTNIVDFNGKTALIYAVNSKNLGAVVELLQHNADINFVDNDQKTALTYAATLFDCSIDSREIFKILAQHPTTTPISKDNTFKFISCNHFNDGLYQTRIEYIKNKLKPNSEMMQTSHSDVSNLQCNSQNQIHF